jgi:hypothetical protein
VLCRARRAGRGKGGAFVIARLARLFSPDVRAVILIAIVGAAAIRVLVPLAWCAAGWRVNLEYVGQVPGGKGVRVVKKSAVLLLLSCWAHGCVGSSTDDPLMAVAPMRPSREMRAPGEDVDAVSAAAPDVIGADVMAAAMDAIEAACSAPAACPAGVVFNAPEGSVIHNLWRAGVRHYCATGCRDRVRGVAAELHGRCLTEARGDDGAAEIWCAPSEAACFVCGDRGAP